MKPYVPSGVPGLFGPVREGEDLSWDVDIGAHSDSYYETREPAFHLLIPAREPTARLCKTLLSAVVLNYPPPVLINYGSNKHDRDDTVHQTYKFLRGKEVESDDLVLIVEEGKAVPRHKRSSISDSTCPRYLVPPPGRTYRRAFLPPYAKCE
jgi:hypothetical protein